MIDEGRVLRRIEHLEQRGRGIAADVGAHLVHLVQHQHRRPRLTALQRVDDPAGDRADISTAMAAHFRLVAHAAERDARELAPQRLGDALPQRRLADARRSHEAENRALRIGIERPHREVLENAFLDRLEVIVVAIENLARCLEVEPVLGDAAPRQRREHIEVGARDLVFGRLRRHLAQALQLAVGNFFRFGRELRFVEPSAELFELVVALAFAQLLADHLQLLAQHVFALILIEAGLHFFLDLRSDLQHLQLLHHEFTQPLQPVGDVVDREQLGFGGQGEVQVRGDEVGQLPRFRDARQHLVQLGAEVGCDVDHARELRDDGALQRFGARVLEQVFTQRLGVRHQPLLALRHVGQPGALQPLHHDAHRAVAELEHPHDGAERADVVELVREGVHHRAFERLHPAHRLHDAEQQALFALDDLVDELNGFGISESQRQDNVGINDELAQGEDRQALH